MDRTKRLMTGAAALALVAGAALADDLTGEAIVRKADKDHRSKDERGVVEMVLVAADGQKSRRVMEILTKTGEGDDDLNLLRFVEPATVRGEAVLTVEASGRADDQWLYLPALKKTKRIASSQRSQRFAATDFTYEDLRTEDFARNSYKKLADAKVDEGGGKQTDCFVVEATPKEPDSSGYSKRLVYVDKARFLVLKVEFFDKQARHQKTLQNRGFEQTGAEKLWRATQSMMDDHLRRTKTVMRFTERAINPGLPASTFTEAALERS